jgi:hypothetical protein
MGYNNTRINITDETMLKFLCQLCDVPFGVWSELELLALLKINNEP